MIHRPPAPAARKDYRIGPLPERAAVVVEPFRLLKDNRRRHVESVRMTLLATARVALIFINYYFTFGVCDFNQ